MNAVTGSQGHREFPFGNSREFLYSIIFRREFLRISIKYQFPVFTARKTQQITMILSTRVNRNRITHAVTRDLQTISNAGVFDYEITSSRVRSSINESYTVAKVTSFFGCLVLNFILLLLIVYKYFLNVVLCR